ncbi:hypothetical protein HanHA89_Chr12g0468571 [Helianthus annuus]|nr:hypothetical protein HanHA89_Chr12g0468571 [Helianthus annuus]
MSVILQFVNFFGLFMVHESFIYINDYLQLDKSDQISWTILAVYSCK